MGTLQHFNIASIKQFYNTRTLVETGTADGQGVEHAIRSRFEKIHSVEIVPEIAEAARLRFKNFPQVQIWEGSSTRCLPMILKEIGPEPCMFWLDAHFPGTYHAKGYSDEPDAARRLPLDDEVRMIRAARPDALDVVLIDDTRIYVPGPYEGGDAPPEVIKAVEGLVERGPHALDWIRELYASTHNACIDYWHQGYLMVFPKVDLLKKAA